MIDMDAMVIAGTVAVLLLLALMVGAGLGRAAGIRETTVNLVEFARSEASIRRDRCEWQGAQALEEFADLVELDPPGPMETAEACA